MGFQGFWGGWLWAFDILFRLSDLGKEHTISASLSISCNPRTSTAEVEIHPDSTEKKGARPDFLQWNCISKTYMYIYIYRDTDNNNHANNKNNNNNICIYIYTLITIIMILTRMTIVSIVIGGCSRLVQTLAAPQTCHTDIRSCR